VEEHERVVAAVRRLMAQYGSQQGVADALGMPDGTTFSQQSVGLALRDGSIGLGFARAVARTLGIGLEELLTGKPPERYMDLPGWPEAALEVAAKQLLPPYVTALVGELPASFPVRRVDADFIVDQGMLWLKHAPLAVRKAAERADIQAERDAVARSEEKRYAMDRSGDVPRRDSRVTEVPVVRDRAKQGRQG
jgi:hypothetical protein